MSAAVPTDSERDSAMKHLLQCRCGRLRGYVVPTGSETHGVCYCRDCQAYARALGQEGDVLDALGGTEVVGVAPRNVVFTEGREALACLSLTENGLLRWYAGCCNSPICNTPRNFKVSFAGVVHTCLRHSTQSVEASFGPVAMRANVKNANGRPASMRMSTAVRLVPFAVSLLRARLSGSYRSTPFFSEDGTPVVVPRVLRKIELERAMGATSTRSSS